MTTLRPAGHVRQGSSRRRTVAALLTALLAAPLVPMISSTAAHAAVASVTFSDGSVTAGTGTVLDGNGMITNSSNSYSISRWNPGTIGTGAGRYVDAGFTVSIPEAASPRDTFTVTMPEHWQIRGAASLVPLTDTATGKTIATVVGSNGSDPKRITFTLTDFVVDNENVAGSYSFQAQEVSSVDRAPGIHTGTLVGNAGSAGAQDILDLKVDVKAATWPAPMVGQSWTGDKNTPAGIVDLRSAPSWNGASPVTMRFTAGNGYDIDCAALSNQDPSSLFGIGLADIGDSAGSLPTTEHLLDPSKYTLDCSADEVTITMPASSWTSADATSGQVLRAVFPRIANGETDWTAEDGVYGYLHLEQNNTSRDLSGFSVRPGSTATGSGNQLPPGAFETRIFRDMNDNDVYDAGVDMLLPDVEVLIEGQTTPGAAVSKTVTTDAEGFASTDLRAGAYTARVQTPPVGMTEVATDAGTDDAIDSDFSGNEVTFSVASRETVKRDAGYRLPMSTIQLSKELTGDAIAALPSGTSFVVDYAYPAGTGFPAGTGTVTLPADGTAVTTAVIPVGAEVSFSERTPAAVAGTVWAQPVFAPATVTVAAGTAIAEVTVTNKLDLVFGAFTVAKELTGTGAEAVPADTIYTVEYSHPAGAAYPAGSGTMDVRADGTPVQSKQLPVGAVVTLAEQKPTAVPNVIWGSATFAPETVTIGEGTPVGVTLTNEATLVTGDFSVTKSLSGSGVSQVPAGTSFTVEYAYPAGTGYPAGAGSLTVIAGETTTVEGIPAGAKVTLTEVSATNPTGGAWGEPVFDHSTFTVLADTTVEINLDNPIDLTTGRFSVKKELAGDATAQVEDGATFTVNYSFPAGEGYEAGEGSFVVQANGPIVTSPELPYGAVVTLAEDTPETIKGTGWANPYFSQSEVTIGDGTTVEVTLTNIITYVEEQIPPTEPRQPNTPGAPQPNTPNLAATGVSGLGLGIGGALLLLAAGAALLIARRQRTSAE